MPAPAPPFSATEIRGEPRRRGQSLPALSAMLADRLLTRALKADPRCLDRAIDRLIADAERRVHAERPARAHPSAPRTPSC